MSGGHTYLRSLHFFGAEIVDLMALPKNFEHSFWKLVIKINFLGGIVHQNNYFGWGKIV